MHVNKRLRERKANKIFSDLFPRVYYNLFLLTFCCRSTTKHTHTHTQYVDISIEILMAVGKKRATHRKGFVVKLYINILKTTDNMLIK